MIATVTSEARSNQSDSSSCHRFSLSLEWLVLYPHYEIFPTAEPQWCPLTSVSDTPSLITTWRNPALPTFIELTSSNALLISFTRSLHFCSSAVFYGQNKTWYLTKLNDKALKNSWKDNPVNPHLKSRINMKKKTPLKQVEQLLFPGLQLFSRWHLLEYFWQGSFTCFFISLSFLFLDFLTRFCKAEI